MKKELFHKFKKDYLGNAIVCQIFFLILFYWSNNNLLASFLFATGLAYILFGLGFYQYQIYLPRKQRKLLRNPRMDGLIEKGFIINEEIGSIDGKIDKYFVRVHWSKFNRVVKNKCGFYIDVYFLEDIRLKPDLKPVPNLTWYIGIIQSVLPATYKIVPTSDEIENEIMRMIDVLKQNHLSPVEIKDWEEIYLPHFDQLEKAKEKARIKKQFKFLGLDIKFLKKAS